MSSIPLLQLVKQLLRNSGSQTVSQLNDLGSAAVDDDAHARRISPHLHLLLRFQRLLFEQVSIDTFFKHKATKLLDPCCRYVNVLIWVIFLGYNVLLFNFAEKNCYFLRKLPCFPRKGIKLAKYLFIITLAPAVPPRRRKI
jgi:hypothetical protein